MVFTAGQEKTEKATPKKRKDAREKEGTVIQSREVSTAATVLGIFLVMMVLAQYMLKTILDVMYNSTATLTEASGEVEFFRQQGWLMAFNCLKILGPICAASVIFAVLPVMLQTKGLFNSKLLKPKFSRLSIINGVKRLFSIQSLMSVLKGLLILTVIGVVAYSKIMERVNQLGKLPDMEVIQGVVFIADSVFEIVITIVVLYIFIAAGDYVFQWWQYEKKLKMSKQEVKDEYKQIEGDPIIKSRIKQKQREIAMRRMMEEVPKADVVIRNPTHFAVALKYDFTKAKSAPIVIAKGKDHLAQRIIEIAQKNQVEVTENRPLARTLYETVDIGQEIPVELYGVVAAILSPIFEKRGNLNQIIGDQTP